MTLPKMTLPKMTVPWMAPLPEETPCAAGC